MGDDHFDVLVIARKCAEQFNPKPANCVHPVRRKAAETLLRKRTEIIAKELLAALRSKER